MSHLLDKSVPEIVAEWYRLCPELEGIFADADKLIADQGARLEMPTGRACLGCQQNIEWGWQFCPFCGMCFTTIMIVESEIDQLEDNDAQTTTEKDHAAI